MHPARKNEASRDGDAVGKVERVVDVVRDSGLAQTGFLAASGSVTANEALVEHQRREFAADLDRVSLSCSVRLHSAPYR